MLGVGRPKEPMQFWGCGGNHKLYDFPHMKEQHQRIHNVEGFVTMENVARETSRIYVVVDDYQGAIVEVGGKIVA